MMFSSSSLLLLWPYNIGSVGGAPSAAAAAAAPDDASASVSLRHERRADSESFPKKDAGESRCGMLLLVGTGSSRRD